MRVSASTPTFSSIPGPPCRSPSTRSRKGGIDVDPTAQKTVTLKIANIVYTYGWTVAYNLNLITDFGNGDRRVVPAYNSSPAMAEGALDGAIMHAVSKLLLDEPFERYMNE